MPSNGTDPTYGSPTFSETLAPAFGTDLSEVARYAGRGGPFRPGTTAERNAASGAAAREGVYWSDTTNGELYKRVSGSWVLVPAGKTIFGHAGKTAGFQSMGGGAVATLTLQDSAGGMTFTDNSLVIPVTGRYQVNARFYFSGAVPGGVGTTLVGQLLVNGSNRAQVQQYKQDALDTTAQLAQIMLLSAGDKLSMYSTTTGSTWGTDGYNGTYVEALRVA